MRSLGIAMLISSSLILFACLVVRYRYRYRQETKIYTDVGLLLIEDKREGALETVFDFEYFDDFNIVILIVRHPDLKDGQISYLEGQTLTVYADGSVEWERPKRN